MSTLVVTALRVVCLAYLTATPPQGVAKRIKRGVGQVDSDYAHIDINEGAGLANADSGDLANIIQSGVESSETKRIEASLSEQAVVKKARYEAGQVLRTVGPVEEWEKKLGWDNRYLKDEPSWWPRWIQDAPSGWPQGKVGKLLAPKRVFSSAKAFNETANEQFSEKNEDRFLPSAHPCNDVNGSLQTLHYPWYCQRKRRADISLRELGKTLNGLAKLGALAVPVIELGCTGTVQAQPYKGHYRSNDGQRPGDLFRPNYAGTYTLMNFGDFEESEEFDAWKLEPDLQEISSTFSLNKSLSSPEHSKKPIRRSPGNPFQEVPFRYDSSDDLRVSKQRAFAAGEKLGKGPVWVKSIYPTESEEDPLQFFGDFLTGIDADKLPGRDYRFESGYEEYALQVQPGGHVKLFRYVAECIMRDCKFYMMESINLEKSNWGILSSWMSSEKGSYVDQAFEPHLQYGCKVTPVNNYVIKYFINNPYIESA